MKFGADVDFVDENSQTLLSLFSQRGLVACVEFLLQNGANTELADVDYDTPLHLAIYK